MTGSVPRPTDDAIATSTGALPPPDGADSVPAWAKDENAKKEERFWANEDLLKGVKMGNDILWHRVYGWVVIALMIFFVFVFVASLGVWIFHYLAPWGWLKADQLSKIQSVIFSGSLGAIVSAFMQRQLGK